MAEKKKNNKKKIILIIGFAILGLGILAGAGVLFAGLITLARDLFFAAVALDALFAGGVLGKKAIDGIVSSISSKKANKLQKNRTVTKDKTEELNDEVEKTEKIEVVPTPVKEKAEEAKEEIIVEEFSFDEEQKEIKAKKSTGQTSKR